MKYLFQISMTSIGLTFFILMGYVTYVAYSRDSGHTGFNMMKVQKMRHDANVASK